jgi:hypothetical protein
VRGTLAPWLFGVARRVAARARVRAAARQAREERAAKAVARRPIAAGATGSPEDADWEPVHDEVGRLPEKYRTPVLLCYLEGATYEEAARRIGCPLGTIRVRLSRARDRLRDRLTRRGFGPQAIAALGWLLHGSEPMHLPPAMVGSVWIDATVKAAQAYAAGPATAAGAVPALALALGNEMVRSLAMSHWKLVMTVLAALGATAATAVGLFGSGAGQDQPGPNTKRATAATAQAATAKKEAPAVAKTLPEPFEVSLAKHRNRVLAAAKQRVDAQRAYYEEGRITTDRFLQAIQYLNAAEMDAATTHEGRVAAAEEHLKRVAEVLKREQAEATLGRGTIADVAEAALAYEQAAVLSLKTQKERGEGVVEVLQKRVDTLEKQLDRVMKDLERNGIQIR